MWLCNECGKKIERLQICWGESGGRKVDIIDYFCPYCPSNNLSFIGTQIEEDIYWDMEWKQGGQNVGLG